jgi:hypothetical protein
VVLEANGFHSHKASGLSHKATGLIHPGTARRPDLYTQIGGRRIKEGRCMIAHVNGGTMGSGFLTSLASHGHRRTRSAAPWASGASASGIALELVYKAQGNALGHPARATTQPEGLPHHPAIRRPTPMKQAFSLPSIFHLFPQGVALG